jgi:hypothetical protein
MRNCAVLRNENYSDQKAGGRGQRAEGRGKKKQTAFHSIKRQEAEGRGQEAEARRNKQPSIPSKGRRQRAEGRRQRKEETNSLSFPFLLFRVAMAILSFWAG